MKKTLRYASASFLLILGLITLFLSTSVIFDLFDIRSKEGNYVLFIVEANFICSILYLISVYGFFKTKRWTIILLVIASVILIAFNIVLKMYISNGGIYETKTVYAMLFRTSLTIALTLIAYFTIPKTKTNALKR